MPTPHRVIGLLAFGATAIAVSLTGALHAAAQEDVPGIVNAGAPQSIKDSYIVVFKDSASVQSAQARVASATVRYGVTAVNHIYHAALSGFSATMSEQQARKLAADPEVAYVQQDSVVRATTEQTNPPSWGLDRIDQDARPLNSRYGYPNDGGSKVHAYVIDTGIRTTHQDFGGRAVSGFDAVDGGTADDCNGHGTHVAGTIGGTQHGVAKRVQLVAVRVLDCGGSGSIAGVIAGVDWVTDHAVKPAVANMSLGGDPAPALDDAVRASIAAGVNYAIAAGNNTGADACGQSPARVGDAVTVAATDRNDRRAGFSNIGSCVDIFAPGVDIRSAWRTSDTATNTISGTSMAAPHVAGLMALIMQVHPTMGAAQISGHLKSNATEGKVIDPGSGSPNRLLRLIHGPVTGLAGKCVGVTGGGTANGTAVRLQDCNGSGSQDWYYTPSRLYNAQSGRCLDLAGAAVVAGTRAVIFDCKEQSSSQGWRWNAGLKDIFLRTTTTPQCLEVAGANPASGTLLQINACNNSTAQDWNLPLS